MCCKKRKNKPGDLWTREYHTIQVLWPQGSQYTLELLLKNGENIESNSIKWLWSLGNRFLHFTTVVKVKIEFWGSH